MLNRDIISSLSTGSQITGHSEDFPSCSLPVLLLIFLGHGLVYHDLRGLENLLKAVIFLVNSPGLPLNELSIFDHEVLHNELLNDSHYILHLVIFLLSQIVSVLLFSSF